MTNPGPARRFGVALLNMGGPATLADVRPFLEALLGDERVTGIPFGPLRCLIARRIAESRAPLVCERYRMIGGGSPLLAQTRDQAEALKAALSDLDIPVAVAMRYTAPRAENALVDLIREGVTDVVLLPLYPQSARATTESSVADFLHKARVQNVACHVITAYPALPGFIEALAGRIADAVEGLSAPVYVFAAHGLPERAARRDHYPAHVDETVARLVERLGPDCRWELAFQSRLGPVRWMRPYLDDTVARLGAEGVKELVVVPVSFVSEHIETLHELDLELRELAESAGITQFRRARTVQCHPAFIGGLAELVRQALAHADREYPA